LTSNDVKLEKFEVLKVIGRGAFAKIYQVRILCKRTNPKGEYKYFAMKVLKKK
jgi:hypothetical protein